MLAGMLNYSWSTYYRLTIVEAYLFCAVSSLCSKLSSQLYYPSILLALAFNRLWHDYISIKLWSALAFSLKVILSEVQKTRKKLTYSRCSLVLSVSAITHQKYIIFFRYFTYCRRVQTYVQTCVFMCIYIFFVHKKKEMYIVGRVICGSHLWHLFPN